MTQTTASTPTGTIREAVDTKALIKRIPWYYRKEGDCFIWKGRLDNNQPSLILRRPQGKRVSCYVKRILWEEKHNEVFVYGQAVTLINTCGNPLCVNPDHMIRVFLRDSTLERMRQAINAYKTIADTGFNYRQMSSHLGIDYHFLRSCVIRYNADPAYWDNVFSHMEK